MPLTFLLSPSSIIPNPTFFGTMRGHNPTGTMIVVYWHSYALFTGRHYYCLPMSLYALGRAPFDGIVL
jgi:hypothetical protein